MLSPRASTESAHGNLGPMNATLTILEAAGRMGRRRPGRWLAADGDGVRGRVDGVCGDWPAGRPRRSRGGLAAGGAPCRGAFDAHGDVERLTEVFAEMRGRAGDLPGWNLLLVVAQAHVDNPITMPVLLAAIAEAARRSSTAVPRSHWESVVAAVHATLPRDAGAEEGED